MADNAIFTGRPSTWKWTLFHMLPWICLIGGYLFFMAKNRQMELDDALIYLRYIDNAIAGNGLVYNEGVRFNGLTSPLFSYLVLTVAFLLQDPSLASFLVSGAAYIAAAIVMSRLFVQAAAIRGVRIPALAGLAGGLVFLALPFFYIFYGMETGLLALMSGLFLWLMRSERYGPAGIVAALLFLTRSEAVLLVFVAGLYDVVINRRLPKFTWATYVVPVILVATVFLFNYVYYGAITPETGMAKIWQGASGLWAGAEFWQAGYMFLWVFNSNVLVVAVLACFGAIGYIALGRDYLNVVVTLYLISYALFYVLLKIPNYGWYYSPFFAFGAFYVGYGLTYVVSGILTSIADGRRWPMLFLAAVPFVGSVCFLAEINSHPRGVYTPYRDIGVWMKGNLDEDSSIAMVEIGTIGYYSGRQIIDILGLVNPENARFIGQRRFDAWLDLYEPDYILVHDPVWDHEVSLLGAAARWSLEEVCEFSRPIYRLFRVDRNGHPGISSCSPDLAYVPGTIDTLATHDESLLGHIDATRVAGNYVVLDGWITNTEGDQFAALGIDSPAATDMVWRRMPRTDVADHMKDDRLQWSGFRVWIRYESPVEAQRAIASICLIVVDGEVRVARPVVDGTACRQPAM